MAGGGACVPAAAAGFEGAALADAVVEPVDLEMSRFQVLVFWVCVCRARDDLQSRACAEPEPAEMICSLGVRVLQCACAKPETASPQISVCVCRVIIHTRNVHTWALNLKIV